MAKKFIPFGILTFVLFLGGCATATSSETTTSSVKGTPTTINTMGGDSFQVLTLIDNSWESVKIAKTDVGVFIFYINVMTNGNRYPGSAIIYIDDKKITIVDPFPSGWSIKDVSVSQYETKKYWRENVALPNTILDALRSAGEVTIRTINTNAYMGQENGIDVTPILPIIKDFIKK